MLVHFITALALVLTVLFIAIRVQSNKEYTLIWLSSVGLFSVLIFALGWEVFEFTNGLVLAKHSYMLDTMIDIFMGICGGLVGVFYVNALLKKNVSN